MVGNYFKIAWRNLVRNRVFTLINIMGLGLGMTCSLLILLWVNDEYNVDDFHANGKQLYHVYEKQYADGKIGASYLTQGLLANELKKKIPEIEHATVLEQDAPFPFTLQANEKIFKLKGTYASEDFFQMFSFPILSGDHHTALNTVNGIAISRNAAKKLFETPENALGKTLRFETSENLIVTAVFENLPKNSSLQFEFLRGWRDYEKNNAWVNNWGSSSPYTFIQIRKDADPTKVEAKIKDFIHQYVPKTNESYTELAIQPYHEKYLHSNFENGKISGGRIEYVRLFSLIAAFILVIACINFVNLATARSTKRAKEVGIRKVVGAARTELIRQFIGEAILLAFLSVIAALLLCDLLLPMFNALTEKTLSLPLDKLQFWSILLSLIIATGLVAGSYPAFILSSFNPHNVMKGSFRAPNGGRLFRKGLVVFQFTLSIILIAGMIVIYRQISFTQTKNLGYDRENLLYIPIEGDLARSYELFKEKAGRIPGIMSITRMKESPTVIGHSVGDISWPGKDPNLNSSFSDATVGFDFVKTLKLQLKEGRDFSKDFSSDSVGYLLNETAVSKIGFENPVGKSISWAGKEGKVIGVIKDFHFNSLHQKIEPLIVRYADNFKWGTILVRIEAGKTSEALTSLESLCKELNPSFPFSYQFSDQEYNKLYKSEQLIGKLSNYFAFLSIFISCLGLFGLALSTAEQKTKEIGVRRVLGASAGNIVKLMSVNFLQPVFIAMAIGFPASRLLMDLWLRNFAYKVEIEWWNLLLAGLIVLVIALITVSYQSIRAARTNPVNSLRVE